METATKSAARATWAAGDYHRFALSTVWPLGPVLVESCGISAGQRVLDVAAGTGNVAIRAALVGATVTASDLTPENLAAGERAAREAGVDLQWSEADAEALPFEDSSFDVVTSCLGAMFAPDHRRVADELMRVCRPGGVIGLIAFTPEGAGGDFFRSLAPYVPEQLPNASSPLSWGSEAYVRELFRDSVDRMLLRRQEYVEEAQSPDEYFTLFSDAFGPVAEICARLRDHPGRLASLEKDFADFCHRWNRGSDDGRIRIPYEYLLVVAHRRV